MPRRMVRARIFQPRMFRPLILAPAEWTATRTIRVILYGARRVRAVLNGVTTRTHDLRGGSTVPATLSGTEED